MIETPIVLSDITIGCIYGQRFVNQAGATIAAGYYNLNYAEDRLNIALHTGILAKDHTILLLGSYAPEQITYLHSVRDALFRVGYRAILLSDIPEATDQTLEEKLLLLGAFEGSHRRRRHRIGPSRRDRNLHARWVDDCHDRTG